MKNVKRLSYSILLSLILTLTLSSVSFASYDDVDGHWANEQIARWSDNGVVQGSNNKFRPAYNISRAEVATILDNVMKYQKKSSNNFVDLKDTWYTDYMLKSVEADIFKGYGSKIRPEDNITREETAIVFARAFDLGNPQGQSSKFTDEKKISSWAKDSVNAMEERGYMNGYDDKFRPQDNITRAEVVQLLDNIVKRLYNKPGTYSEDIDWIEGEEPYGEDGIVVINNSNVKFKGSNISHGKEVIISEGASNGHFYLDDTMISSTLKVHSSATKISIDSSDVQHLKIVGQNISINTKGKTNISTVFADVTAKNATINKKLLPLGETLTGYYYVEDIDMTSEFYFNKKTQAIEGYKNDSFKNIVIPDKIAGINVKHIAGGPFYNKGIKTLILPNDLESIDDVAFQNNELTEIIIPEGVTTIGRGAFGSNKLTQVTIPSSVTTIAEGSFTNNQLTEVTVPKDADVNEFAFDKGVKIIRK